MIIDPATYYTLVALIVLLAALLTGVALSYFLSSRRLSKLEKKESEVIEVAQNQAEKIISEAIQIYYASENKINQTADRLSDQETRELSEKSAEFVKLFDEKIAELNQEKLLEFKKMSEDMEKAIILHFDELKNLLSQQTVASEKLAEDKIKQEYDKLEKELSEYKREQLTKINNNIFQILLNISKEVFGKKLDTHEHEEMIAKALQDAEREMN